MTRPIPQTEPSDGTEAAAGQRATGLFDASSWSESREGIAWLLACRAIPLRRDGWRELPSRP